MGTFIKPINQKGTYFSGNTKRRNLLLNSEVAQKFSAHNHRMTPIIKIIFCTSLSICELFFFLSFHYWVTNFTNIFFYFFSLFDIPLMNYLFFSFSRTELLNIFKKLNIKSKVVYRMICKLFIIWLNKYNPDSLLPSSFTTSLTFFIFISSK